MRNELSDRWVTSATSFESRELRALFAEAIEMQPAERVTWMLQKRAENPVLADELLSLLEHADADDQFLETPALQSEQALGNQPRRSRRTTVAARSFGTRDMHWFLAGYPRDFSRRDGRRLPGRAALR